MGVGGSRKVRQCFAGVPPGIFHVLTQHDLDRRAKWDILKVLWLAASRTMRIRRVQS